MLELEKIDLAIKDSLNHSNNVGGETNFTAKQIEVLSEAIRAAFEAYNKQVSK